jgi:preprotein translocase subunit SecY
MKEIFSTYVNAFKLKDTRDKILFTLAMIALYRVGAHLPVPGINSAALHAFFKEQAGGLLGFYDMFAGGAFGRMTIFSLGIMPYISSSIIMSLLQVVIPSLEKLAKEGGEAGRRKIMQYSRYGTVFLALINALGISIWIQSIPNIVINPGLGFHITTVIAMTTGAIFIMWMGERITEKGIGNGASVLIFANIVERIPWATRDAFRLIYNAQMSPVVFIVILAFMLAVTMAVVFIQGGTRRIPIQHARRVVGGRVYGGQTSYLPLKVDHSGVIAVIFASSILLFPATIAQFSNIGFLQTLSKMFSPGALLHDLLYVLLIIFFCYFYTAIIVNPSDIAENLQKYGSFIPGVRPGKATSAFIDRILTRITLAGAIFVALIAIMPYQLIRLAHVPFYFGGTSLLIVVGVSLEVARQLESQLMMRHYEGFIRRGRIRSRGY